MGNILDEANELTNVDRQNVYGHPLDDFSKVVEMSAPILKSDIDPRLKHALYMIQVKIARLLNTPGHRDSVVDIAGYANTYDMMLERLDSQPVCRCTKSGPSPHSHLKTDEISSYIQPDKFVAQGFPGIPDGAEVDVAFEQDAGNDLVSLGIVPPTTYTISAKKTT